MKNKLVVITLVGVTLVVGALLVSMYMEPSSPVQPSVTPTTLPKDAPEGAQAPTEEWLRDFDKFAAENKALTADRTAANEKFQPRLDQLVGLSQRLIQQVPTGMIFDEKLRIFVPAQTQPAPEALASPGPKAGN